MGLKFKTLTIYLLLIIEFSHAGEDSTGGLSSIFENLTATEARESDLFQKSIPSIQMPGTKSYFKATSLCISGKSLKTKKVVDQACMSWRYKKGGEFFRTEDRVLATKLGASCSAYNTAFLSHPIEYTEVKTVYGVEDDEGNLISAPLKVYDDNVNIVKQERILYRSAPKHFDISFYDRKSSNIYNQAKGLLGKHRFRLDECR